MGVIFTSLHNKQEIYYQEQLKRLLFFVYVFNRMVGTEMHILLEISSKLNLPIISIYQVGYLMSCVYKLHLVTNGLSKKRKTNLLSRSLNAPINSNVVQLVANEFTK